MNTAKTMKSAAFAFMLALALGACSNGNGGTGKTYAGGGQNTNVSQPAVLTESPYQLAGSEEGAADFAAINTGYESPFTNDTCWNITPGFVSENSEFTVFKYASSNETFVMYDGAAYPIGGGYGGDGVTSMALADLTGDGVYELCYVYSEDSILRVGYFDPAQKTANELSGSFSGQPVMLSSEGNTLTVCAAEVSNYESLLEMTLTAGEKLAEVTIGDGTPELKMEEK